MTVSLLPQIFSQLDAGRKEAEMCPPLRPMRFYCGEFSTFQAEPIGANNHFDVNGESIIKKSHPPELGNGEPFEPMKHVPDYRPFAPPNQCRNKSERQGGPFPWLQKVVILLVSTALDIAARNNEIVSRLQKRPKFQKIFNPA